MKDQEKDPFDQKLSRIYQQRKRRLDVPEELHKKSGIRVKPSRNVDLKLAWLTSPVWYSAVSACFILVMSVYLLPINDVNYEQDEGTFSTNSMNESPQLEMALPESTNVAAANQEQNQVARTRRTTSQKLSTPEMIVQEVSVSDTEAEISNINATSQTYSLTAKKDVTSKEKLTMADAAYPAKSAPGLVGPNKLSDTKIAKSKMTIESTAVKPTFKIGRIVSIKTVAALQTTLVKLEIDCEKRELKVRSQRIEGIQQGDWVRVEFNEKQHVTAVTKSVEQANCR